MVSGPWPLPYTEQTRGYVKASQDREEYRGGYPWYVVRLPAASTGLTGGSVRRYTHQNDTADERTPRCVSVRAHTCSKPVLSRHNPNRGVVSFDDATLYIHSVIFNMPSIDVSPDLLGSSGTKYT